MKKTLLTLVAAFAATAASAAVADLTKVWENPVENAYQADSKEWNAPVAVDADGNVIATGAFTEELTIAGTTLEAVGTSAYVVKYDNSGAAVWAVSLSGAATITALDTDATGNIYIAGTIADEVSFGTTSGDPIVKEGLKIDDAFTVKQNASFIAKYSPEGVLAKIVTFVPEPFPDLLATEMYYPEDGDVFFRINNIQVVGSKVYASAIYTNVTTYDGVKFEANYNDPWGGVFFDQVKASSVFSLNSSLGDCMSVARCGAASNLATDEAYWVKSVNFTVNDGKVYAVFTGNGPLEIKANAFSKKTVDATSSDYNYILAVIDNGTIPQLATSPCPAAGFSAAYVPAFVAVSNETLYVAGNESYTKEDESYSEQLFVMTAPVKTVADVAKNVYESVDGDVTYYDVTSAALLPGDAVYINALGYYNCTKRNSDNEVLYSNGDFAGVAKSFVYAADAFSPATAVNDAVGVAATGTYVAFSQIGENGQVFSLYNDADAGIADVISDENAPAEYFNLQGVRVANPENGLYIVRQGKTVNKQIIR